MINCDFINPVYWDSRDLIFKPVDKDTGFSWQFSGMDCEGSLDNSTTTLPEYLERIEGSESSFILDKKISYGDFLVVAFLIIIFLGLAIGGIREFAKNRKLERL